MSFLHLVKSGTNGSLKLWISAKALAMGESPLVHQDSVGVQSALLVGTCQCISWHSTMEDEVCGSQQQQRKVCCLPCSSSVLSLSVCSWHILQFDHPAVCCLLVKRSPGSFPLIVRSVEVRHIP